MEDKVFICFAAEDRYRIVESIVFHLKNYGIIMWYDRYSLVLGDNRIQKNLVEGAFVCKYAVIIISEFTSESQCAMEEISIIKERYYTNDVIVFPILYELPPEKLSINLQWIKELIFKEATSHSGTYEICNHIACKITGDILQKYSYRKISNVVNSLSNVLPSAIYQMLIDYQEIDAANLNSKITLLYAIYITLKDLMTSLGLPSNAIISSVFTRLFCETKLSLSIDYRELWLLENCTCILINQYAHYCIESKI